MHCIYQNLETSIAIFLQLPFRAWRLVFKKAPRFAAIRLVYFANNFRLNKALYNIMIVLKNLNYVILNY